SLKTFSKVSISEQLRRMYLGGKGLGLKLLYDRIKPGIDPLGVDNFWYWFVLKTIFRGRRKNSYS
ncbi:MAG: hypothetical protein K8S13_03635, partial [Desulfobacula sp.]|uniref:aldehyde ferredoxin oxidoreductase N-terminal domain-containing protein n=1 Tax=Desulfobacula sp. TaxID=2593537 RepID=UPI0025C43E41